MEFSASAVGENSEAVADAEEVFAIAVKEVTRDWQGFGNDIMMRSKHPEYYGGQHFGQNDDSSSEDEEDLEDGQDIAAVQGLSLMGSKPEGFAADSGFFHLQ
jgi:hypothetical protein